MIYGIAPDDIIKFLTIENGTNIEGQNEALVGSTIATTFDLKIGSRIKIGFEQRQFTPGCPGCRHIGGTGNDLG